MARVSLSGFDINMWGPEMDDIVWTLSGNPVKVRVRSDWRIVSFHISLVVMSLPSAASLVAHSEKRWSTDTS